MRLTTLTCLCVLALTLGGCSDDSANTTPGNNQGGTSVGTNAQPAGDPAAAPGPSGSGNPVAPAGFAASWNPVFNGPLPAAVNHHFTCQTGDAVFQLRLDDTNQASFQDDTGTNLPGRYSTASGRVEVTFDNGAALASIGHATDSGQILAMVMALADGQQTDCMLRIHDMGEHVAQDFEVLCGDDPNVPGGTLDAFTLTTVGSAQWEYFKNLVFEGSGTFIGTYRLDSAAGQLAMVFLDNGELRFFTAATAQGFTMLSVPPEGSAAVLAGMSCLNTAAKRLVPSAAP